MKDILLIDDNSRNQRMLYGASFVDEELYADILHHIERVNNSIAPTFINGCKCVMLHDSLEDFIDGNFDQHSHQAKDIIVEYLEDHEIPYVCFSDGHESTGVYDLDNNLIQIKKSDFYNRLKYFLDFYRTEGVLQFHILAYGKNYCKELMIRYVRALFRKFEMKRPNDLLSSSDVMPEKTVSTIREENYLEKIILLSQPALGMDYNDILSFIDDEEICVSDFRLRINNILNSVIQNGKNTYTWK